jgi:hypothetical protein
MTDIRSIHHVNFIFRDLEKAIERFESVPGIGPFRIEELPERGVRTARALVGGTWFVIVSPTRADSAPGQYLEEHGEGFFLLSFGVVDIDKAVAALGARDPDMKIGAVRAGVGHWRVADLPTDATLGVQIQLTEDPGIDGEER